MRATHRGGIRRLLLLLAFAPLPFVTHPAIAQLSEDWQLCIRTQSLPDEGIEACTRIIRSGKERGRNLAIAYNNRGDGFWARNTKEADDKAMDDYTQAIRIDPRYAVAYINRGLIFYRKDDMDSAIADYTRSIEINPKDPMAYNNRGNAYKKKGALDNALADYDDAIKLDKRPVAIRFANRGNVWLDKGEIDRAIADFDEAIRIDPDFPAAFTGRGLAYEKKGDVERAKADFTESLKLPPRYDSAQWAHDKAKERLEALSKG
jgi:tetratricopeptide (TPR) repeat protein